MLRSEQHGKKHFMNTAGGSRMSFGVGGMVTGLHAHFIIIDDALDPKGALSEADLNTSNYWLTNVIPTRKKSQKVSFTVLIMQRLHQDDATGHLLELDADPIRHICLPAELAANVKPRHLRRFYKNGLLDPVRLDQDVLARMKKRGEFFYASQFSQNPVPLEGGMFKIDRMTVDVAPLAKRFVRRVRYWDKAGTGGDGAYTVGLLMGLDRDGRFWVLDIVRGQWEAAQRERVIQSTAAIDGKQVEVGIEQEPGSGGKESAQGTVKRLAGWRVTIDIPKGDKALRADPFAVQVNGGNTSMVSADWNQTYVGEMRFFPYSKYKDQADASSGAFAMLTKPRMKLGGFGR